MREGKRAALYLVLAIGLAAIVPLAVSRALRQSGSAPPPRDVALDALVSGCASLVMERNDAGGLTPACTLNTDRKVRVFVPGTDGVEVDLGQQAITPALVNNPAGGRVFIVTVPEGMRSFTVRRVPVAGPRAAYTQLIAALPRPAWFVDAQALRQKGDLSGAETLTIEALGAAKVTDDDRAMAEGLLARIAMRRGKIDDADRHFRAAIDLDKRAGRVSDRADDAFALVFMLHQRARRYPEARRVLDEVAGDLAAYPDGRAREPLYRGQVAWEAGDTRTALRELAVAIERADRLGAEGIGRAARQVRGMVMCNAGTTRSCLAALRQAEEELFRAENVSMCERAELAVSLGFAELAEAEASPTTDTTGATADARALTYVDGGCPDTYVRTLALEHLAMKAVLERSVGDAQRWLAEAKTSTSEPRLSDALFWLDVEAKIHALEGKTHAALAKLEEERARAAASGRDGDVVRALVGRGRVLESASRGAEALIAYRAAEDVLDDAAIAMPFGEGRSSISAESATSAQRAASILITLHREAEALDVVRRARARLVRSLAHTEQVAALKGADRDRWELAIADYRSARDTLDAEAASDWKMARPALEAATASRKVRQAKLRAALDDAMAPVGGVRASSLPALAPGELVLAYADLGGKMGNVGFSAEAGKVHAFAFSAGGAIGEKLLAPFDAAIERATRIRILADGALATLDFHAMTWRGMPLVAHAPVVYGLDLGAPSRQRAAAGAGARRTALVVSDPTGDLPSAREEGKTAIASLSKRYDARTLTGTGATAASVRESLAGVALLHYAGHGVFAGREGAESALPLAHGGALTVGDVLALSGVPDQVILSGCEAGRQLGALDEGAAGLASAFLVAGSSEVIAPARVVDDASASALARDLHAALDADGATDLASALRAAQVRASRDGRRGWEAFRAFSR